MHAKHQEPHLFSSQQKLMTIAWFGLCLPLCAQAMILQRTQTLIGASVTHKAPDTLGDYELRYITASNNVSQRRPIRIDKIEATLVFQPKVEAGTALTVIWRGPGYPGDVVLLEEASEQGTWNWLFGIDVARGNPLSPCAPNLGGIYRLSDALKSSQPLRNKPFNVKTKPVYVTHIGAGAEQAGLSL